MRSRVLVFVAMVWLGGSSAFGLTDEEVFREFRFNFISPGARSLALGGAFISLADDATAAQANPAGLGFFLRPEYFVELRAIDNGARSRVIRETLPSGLDTFVASSTDVADVISPSFLSAVTTYGRWSMGLSLQDVLNVDNSTVSSFAFTFQDSPGVFLAVGQGSIRAHVNNLNVSVGVRVSDRFGPATATLSRLSVDAEVVNTVVDTNAIIADQAIPQPVLDLRTAIDDHDDDVAYNVGFLYKWPERWQVGAVVRRAPRFELHEEIDAAGVDLFGVRSSLGAGFPNGFALPDSAGIGGSLFLLRDPDLGPQLALAASVERTDYSSLLDDYVPGVNLLTGSDASFEIDDATDYRVGAEYVLAKLHRPLALRAGAFTEADTSITAVDTGSQGFATTRVFAGGDRRVHGTVGLGVTLSRFQIDVAADFAETDNEYLISLIYKGKR